MEMKEKSTGHTVERVTLNGVDIIVAGSDPNEVQVEKVFAAFAAIDQSEKPSVIISTTTPTM